MNKISLALVAIVAIVAAAFTPSRTARAQTATRIEYARVTPYMVHVRTSPNSVQERHAYRACVATVNDWTCREFEPTDSSTSALRTTLATLGNEGWELVSAVNEDPNLSTPMGLTYLFKRQVR